MRSRIPPPRPVPRPVTRANARAAFTMVEVLIVLALVAVLAGAIGPQLTSTRSGANVRSARAELAAVIDAARGAAIQRGRVARFILRGDSLALALVEDDGPGDFEVVRTVALRREYRVTVMARTAADTLIAYDGRGLARPRLGRVARLVVTANGTSQRDSVCVSNVGLLLPRECTL